MDRYDPHQKKSLKCVVFCWLKEPFICKNTPSVIPSIHNNIPFVGIHGFTLIELIVTITIAGILVAIATPYLGSFISSTRLTTQANELLTDLNTARSEAVKRASYVGVCASTSGSSCTSGGSFLNGWIVFLDADNSGTWTSGDSIIKVHGALDGGNTTVSGSSTVIFNSSGSLENSSSTITYTFCDSALQKSRQISVTATGRASSETGTC